MGYVPVPVAERLWSKVRKQEDGCWEWFGTKVNGGYGQIWINRERGKVHAHRVAYELTYGPIPDGLWVLHHCDNPPCCRPDHLFLGTRIDNARDAKMKGRHAHGDRHGMRLHPERRAIGERQGGAKLTEDIVRAIRRRHREGSASCEQMALEYGVHKRVIYKVILRESWKHVE